MKNKKELPGRPTKYKKEFAQQAYKLCLLGATDTELANFFEVNEDTIHEWKKNNKQFSESVREGKLAADANVAEGLYKRAVGYQYDETTFEKIDLKIDGESSDEKDIKTEAFKRKVITKMIAPDPGAAMNWLSNRQKDKWRQKQTLEFEFEKMTDDQLDLIIDTLFKRTEKNEK